MPVCPNPQCHGAHLKQLNDKNWMFCDDCGTTFHLQPPITSSTEEDFEKAEQIMEQIEKKYPQTQNRGLLFALCLIYARQLSHHREEEANFARKT